MAEVIELGDVTIRFLVEPSGLGGGASVFEAMFAARAKVPRPHSHDAYDETVYGVEGVATFTVDGSRHDVGPGDVLVIERGALHGFENEGDTAAKVLLVVTPGLLGPEYFRELREVLAAGGPPDPAAVGAVMQRHGMTPA